MRVRMRFLVTMMNEVGDFSWAFGIIMYHYVASLCGNIHFIFIPYHEKV